MKRYFSFGAGLLFAALHAPMAYADGNSAARAQALFDQALKLARENKFKEACPLFRASQEAEARSGTGINLAVCYEKTYRLATAWATYREVVALSQREGNAEREEQAKKKLAQLEPQLPRLTIAVPEDAKVKGLRVTRDDVEVPQAEWGVSIPVDSGSHRIAVDAPGRWDWQESVTVQGDPRIVHVPVLRSKTWWTTGRKIGVPVAAAGVAVLATGLVFGLVANGKYGDVVSSNNCVDNLCDPGSNANKEAQSARDMAAVSTAMTISGLVLAAGGAALIVFTPPRKPTQAATRSFAPSRLALKGGPGWMGLAGTFD